jgi:recombination protein RecA
LIVLGVAANIVDKSGAWFSYEGQRIGQGKENAKVFLKENPVMAAAIEQKIRANAGLVAGAMMETPATAEEEADA